MTNKGNVSLEKLNEIFNGDLRAQVEPDDEIKCGT